MRYSTSNPVMTQNFWSNIQGQSTMTLQGTIGKLAYLLGIVTITAFISAYVALDALAAGNTSVISGMAWGGLLGGIVVALMLFIMRPENPGALMTIYAVLQGMFVGATVHSLSEAKAVKENGNCDYIGLGPFRSSETKPGFRNFLSEDQIFQIAVTQEPTHKCN